MSKIAWRSVKLSNPLAMSQRPKTVGIVFQQTSINLCPWLQVSLTIPWLMRRHHESSVRQNGKTDPHTTFVIFIPATVSTIFKTRTHQLVWRMAERKSFFCAGEDSCVFISQLSSSSSPPCVCLLVERVTQQPSQEDVRILRMSNWEFPSSQSGFASYH